jgi:hypothetical protein
MILGQHVPVWDWRWLGLRLKCGACNMPYPCPDRVAALAHLAAELQREPVA